ncbi:hypothetical protein FOA52_014758 [Chlamydomonas sp. UWO 241]|nr:hypothetical protein FOA52_014758 [Chlamydomonas sp. UWO 241]
MLRLSLLALAAYVAWDSRMYAIREYGMLIHEFDPWFNFHATEYLHINGLKKFFTWFDHTAWYPIGRPVGTTIYPGMQLTSVAIWHVLKYIGMPMSLNDICVYVPTWFGAAASLVTGALAAEASGVPAAAPAAAYVMALIPAHTMRSVGGGYDNESIAVTAMVGTFYLWVRCLRTKASWPWAIAAAAAYTYMVAAWGGYVFVINTIGAHAGLLLLLGRAGDEEYKAFTIFFTLGTLGAMQVPCVYLTPIKSLEQIGPLAIFIGYQVVGLWRLLGSVYGYPRDSSKFRELRLKVALAAGGVAALVLGMLIQMGHFGPVSARVSGLFIKHMKTGNPLVDSVAEHQPTRPDAYWAYLNTACVAAPAGWALLFWRPTHAKIFVLMWAVFGAFFSRKMSRLIILMGPIASVLSGISIGLVLAWALSQYVVLLEVRKFWDLKGSASEPTTAEETPAEPTAAVADADADKAAALSPGPPSSKKADKAAKYASKKEEKKAQGSADTTTPLQQLVALWDKACATAAWLYDTRVARVLRVAAAIAALYFAQHYAKDFYGYGHMFAERMSNPSLIVKGRLQNGREVTVTDYLDSYKWLAANTPLDARVLSWWDYGYQISGIANRTTLADGNTWNHEHIALVGRCLALPEKRAHKLVRHLADYVLVWSGGGGDDLAKSPHIARISNSVFGDICPNDPMCYTFTINQRTGQPTPTMAASLLFKLTENKVRPDVAVDPELFKEVYTSKFRKVRIYEVLKVSKKSRAWVANPANRLCDAPGSWYCPGQYPPGLPVNMTSMKQKGFKSLDYNKHGLKGADMGFQRE